MNLPSEDVQTPETANSPRMKRQPRALDVLVIEDEAIIAKDIELIVSDLGHRVIGPARTQEEAVSLALKTRPAVVVADVKLADGSSGILAVNEMLKSIDAAGDLRHGRAAMAADRRARAGSGDPQALFRRGDQGRGGQGDLASAPSRSKRSWPRKTPSAASPARNSASRHSGVTAAPCLLARRAENSYLMTWPNKNFPARPGRRRCTKKFSFRSI